MIFRPYEAQHLVELASGIANELLEQVLTNEPQYAEAMALAGPAWTVFAEDRIIACWGFKHEWRGRATGWMITAPTITLRQWVAIRNRARLEIAKLHEQGTWRIEANVLESWPEGRRFIEGLGFEPEAVFAHWDVLGRNHVHYRHLAPGALP